MENSLGFLVYRTFLKATDKDQDKEAVYAKVVLNTVSCLVENCMF